MDSQKNKVKTYIAISLVTIIIIIAWAINFRNNITQKYEPNTNDLKSLNTNLEKIFSNIDQFKSSFKQSPTSTSQLLQGGPTISPNELDKIIQNLKISNSTNTTSTNLILATPTTTNINNDI